VGFLYISHLTGRPTLHLAISATLHAQHATFISLASKTAALDADLKKIKALYTQLWRSKTGSMRDPFNDLDRNRGDDFGLDSLHVK
jgi:nucleoporin p58/p45